MSTARPSRLDRSSRRNRMSRNSPRIRLGYAFTREALAPRRLEQLPASAEDFHKLKTGGWEAILLLLGSKDPSSPLFYLKDHKDTLIREIHSYLFHPWAKHVRLTIPAPLVGNSSGFGRLVYSRGRTGCDNWSRRHLIPHVPATSHGQEEGFVSFSTCGKVEFPEPHGQNVNMMPFILGDKTSLPLDLQCYYDMIEQCPYVREEIGNVAYVTVQEGFVDVNKTQRRPGLHIESPGVFADDADNSSFTPASEHPWGAGVFFGPDIYEGGIYFASSVGGTSRVYDALVDRTVPGIVDRWGGCEKLRDLLGPGTTLEAGDLCWMTDCTPHEAVPQETAGYRQFFRLVMPAISHWYEDHSTANKKVPLPDHVKVVRGNKFQGHLTKV